jgi:hypothetical protein
MRKTFKNRKGRYLQNLHNNVPRTTHRHSEGRRKTNKKRRGGVSSKHTLENTKNPLIDDVVYDEEEALLSEKFNLNKIQHYLIHQVQIPITKRMLPLLSNENFYKHMNFLESAKNYLNRNSKESAKYYWIRNSKKIPRISTVRWLDECLETMNEEKQRRQKKKNFTNPTILWIEYKTDKNIKFYYNQDTGETTEKLPENAESIPVPPEKKPIFPEIKSIFPYFYPSSRPSRPSRSSRSSRSS